VEAPLGLSVLNRYFVENKEKQCWGSPVKSSIEPQPVTQSFVFPLGGKVQPHV
jgi:hypothetical protein